MGPAPEPKRRNDAFVVTKWSSRPSTPAESKLVRSRINQRRHRERVRYRIADLESSLARVQDELQTANSTIRRLQRELEAACTPTVPVAAAPRSGSEAATSPPTHHLAVQRLASSDRVPRSPNELLVDGQRARHVGAVLPSRGSGSPLMPSTARVTCCTERDEFTQVMRSEETTCRHLPPPSSTESTTLCGEACHMVMAHNFAGMEVAALLSWLRPGFRGATEEGGECRVENVLLLSLLDYIS